MAAAEGRIMKLATRFQLEYDCILIRITMVKVELTARQEFGGMIDVGEQEMFCYCMRRVH